MFSYLILDYASTPAEADMFCSVRDTTGMEICRVVGEWGDSKVGMEAKAKLIAEALNDSAKLKGQTVKGIEHHAFKQAFPEDSD